MNDDALFAGITLLGGKVTPSRGRHPHDRVVIEYAGCAVTRHGDSGNWFTSPGSSMIHVAGLVHVKRTKAQLFSNQQAWSYLTDEWINHG